MERAHGTAALLSQTLAPKAELKFQLKRACYGRGKEIHRHTIAHAFHLADFAPATEVLITFLNVKLGMEFAF
jgi:hypothetical protein